MDFFIIRIKEEKMKQKVLLLITLLFLQLNAITVADLADFSNKKSNYLYGKGLIIGLKGTGDRTKFTNSLIFNILKKENIKINARDVRSKNVAAIMINASLSPFLKKGDKFSATISSIGDAKSIKNGFLVFTFLKAGNGKKYATCQGKISVKDNNNNGVLINGCILEREIPNKLINKRTYNLSLKTANLEHLFKIKEAINKKYGYQTAISIDMKNIKLSRPDYEESLDFMYHIMQINLDIDTFDDIIIDMDNEILISGHSIKIKPVQISGDNFNLIIGLSDTLITKNEVKIKIKNNNKPTIGLLIDSLNSINVPFRQIVNILNNLRINKAFENKIVER